MTNIIEIVVTGKNLATPALAAASADAQGLNKTIDKMSKVAAVGLIGIGAESVKMAASFDASMTRLNTQAAVSKDQIGMLSKGVLDLASQVGQSPDSLAESLLHVESNFQSIGITSSKALELVKVSAEGASVGGANLVDVTNALTAAVASGIPGVQDLQQAMGVLNATVGSGDMQMQDLANAFSTGLLATVKGFGLSITDVGAALATFGDNFIRGQVAATDLRMAVQALAAPVGTGKKTLDSLGMSTKQLAQDMQSGGLLKALEDLKTHMDNAGVAANQQGQIITDVFGKKAGVGINILIGQLDRVKSKYPDLENQANDFGQAWDTTSKTTAQKLNDLKDGFEAIVIELGQRLLPLVTTLVGWLVQHKTVVVDTVLALGVFATALVLYTTSAKAAAVATKLWSVATGELDIAEAANPVGLITLAVVALGVAIFELVKNWQQVWGDIKKWSEDAWKFIYDGWGKYLLPVLGPAGLIALGAIELSKHWKQIWGDIKQVSSDFNQWIWNDFGAKIEGFFVNTVPRWFGTSVHAVAGAWGAVYNAVVAPVVHAYNDVMGLLTQVVNFIGSIPGRVAGMASSVAGTIGHALNPANWFAHGGVVGAATGGPRGSTVMVGEHGPELVRLPFGSTVMSNPDTQSYLAQQGGGGGGNVTVTLELTGGDQEFLTFLRNIIRVRAGSGPNSVQQALGQSF